MQRDNRRVCPAEHSWGLLIPIRKWFHNPQRILRDFVKEGMTALDVGCGPGFFSLPMATMVGKTGKVIAADLQEGMLKRLKDRVSGQEIEERIQLHRCEEDRLGIAEPVDFILAFYMVHEVRNPDEFFRELKSILKPDGQLLVVEPRFHVSKKAFEETVTKAIAAGFTPAKGPNVFFSKSVVLRHTS
jgi:ubiquinone/menaquinone biosynthesis C-methylase UbiE